MDVISRNCLCKCCVNGISNETVSAMVVVIPLAVDTFSDVRSHLVDLHVNHY